MAGVKNRKRILWANSKALFFKILKPSQFHFDFLKALGLLFLFLSKPLFYSRIAFFLRLKLVSPDHISIIPLPIANAYKPPAGVLSLNNWSYTTREVTVFTAKEIPNTISAVLAFFQWRFAAALHSINWLISFPFTRTSST